MTPFLIAVGVVIGYWLIVLFLAEVAASLREQRRDARSYLLHCEEIVEKEMQ